MGKLSPRKDRGLPTSPWNVLPGLECIFLLFKLGGHLVLLYWGPFQGRGKSEFYTIICPNLA